jgi:hypothetical protein
MLTLAFVFISAGLNLGGRLPKLSYIVTKISHTIELVNATHHCLLGRFCGRMIFLRHIVLRCLGIYKGRRVYKGVCGYRRGDVSGFAKYSRFVSEI